MTENTSPAMSNDPAAYAKHHGVMQPKDTAYVLHTFEGCLHVGLRHASDELESRSVANRILAEARDWCRRNGFTLGSKVSEGVTLGPERSETRHIFTYSRPEGAALESLRRAREI